MYPALLSNNSAPQGAPQAQPQMQQQQAPQPMTAGAPAANGYAHGGHIKRGKMVMAHMNKHELDTLDHLQGKSERCPRSGMRSYTHLEELLKNPHILSNVHHHVRQHHASGGMAQQPQQMASHGIHGDNEMALIGPHTHQVFNQLSRMQGYKEGDLVNPTDGRPQYWSLGGILGGIGNAIKGGASRAWEGIKSAAPTIGHYAGKAGNFLLNAAGPEMEKMAAERYGPLGGLAASGLVGLGKAGSSAMEGLGQGNSTADAAIEGGSRALGAYYGGASPMQAAGQGLQQASNRFSGPVGGAMEGFGHSLARGQGLGATARNVGEGALAGAGGQSGVKSAAMDLMKRYQGGQNPMQAAGQMAQQSAQHALPTQESMGNQNAFQEMPFAGGY